MRDPNRLREQARRCRTLAKIVIDPELVEQLRMRFIKLTDEAETAERSAAEMELTIMSL